MSQDFETALSEVESILRVTQVEVRRTLKGSTAILQGKFDPPEPMSLEEGRLAYYRLALENDLRALESAWANEALTDQQLRDTSAALKKKYHRLMQEALRGETDG